MFARWKGLLIALAVVLGGGTVLTGCRVTQAVGAAANPHGVVYCTIIADPPVRSGNVINGPGRFRCDDTGADTITMTVSLQERAANGSWKTLVSRTFVAHGVDTTRTRSETQRTRDVSAKCATGNFRTSLHAVEVSKGASLTVDDHSVTVPSPCSYRL